MNSLSIQALYKGKRRNISKQQYSKLRPYNKIKSSRTKFYDGGNDHTGQSQYSSQNFNAQEELQSNSRQGSKGLVSRICQRQLSQQITHEQLVQVIQDIENDIKILREENQNYTKQIRKQQKIDRLILKKFPFQSFQQQFLTSFDLEQQDRNQIYKRTSSNIYSMTCRKSMNLKTVQLMLQIKLALEVIELENILELKNQQVRRLEKLSMASKRRFIQSQLQQQLYSQKLKFTKLLVPTFSLNKHLQNQNQVLKVCQSKLKSLNQCLAHAKKQKSGHKSTLQQLNFDLKYLHQLSKAQQHNRTSNLSNQYIEMQNGQLISINQQDLKKEIKDIRQCIANNHQEMEKVLEHRMIEKIGLISEIQKYGGLVKNMQKLINQKDKKQGEKGRKLRESIKISQ